MATSPPRALGRNEFAALTGYSQRQVSDWLKDGMPCERSEKRGAALRINPAEAIPWLLKRAEKRVQGRGVVSMESARLRRAQAERAELENEERRRELIPAADVEEITTRAMATVVSMLDALGSRLAPAVAGEVDVAAIRQIVLNETRSIRDIAAAELAGLGHPPDPGGHPAGATAADAGSVGGRKAKPAGR